MRSVRSKLILLAVLGLAWVLLFALRRPAQPPARTAAAPRTAAAQGGGIPRLKLELLNLPRAPYPGEAQNIFGSPPPPPLPPGPVEAARPQAPVAPAPDSFQEEARQIRFVGFLRDGSAATAFLVQGQQVYTVKVGETVAGRFRVAEVGEDFVVLASPAGDKQARLTLAADAGAGARPQAAGAPPGPMPGLGR